MPVFSNVGRMFEGGDCLIGARTSGLWTFGTVELVHERPDCGSSERLSRFLNVRILEVHDGYRGARTSK